MAAAERMATSGNAPAFWFNFRPPETDLRIKRLRAAKCQIHFHDWNDPLLRIRRRFSCSADRTAIESSLRSTIRTERPTHIVLNQGGNSDASVEAPILQQENVPYSVLCHAATESSWPGPDFLPAMRAIFSGAMQCLFVSEWIWQLTEVQVGMKFDNATVVYNPCKFSTIQSSPWPPTNTAFSLAAVSRIENKQKGHDLILRTLALPEWRARPLNVTFYGEGPHRKTLESYSDAIELDSIHFAGHVEDIRAIWHRHHGFIQASRYEGYGLSLLEAMFCERMAITTPIPAAREFMSEGETGFLARAASVEEMSKALDRAWKHRTRWQEMGAAAAIRVEADYPKDPVAEFMTLTRSFH